MARSHRKGLIISAGTAEVVSSVTRNLEAFSASPVTLWFAEAVNHFAGSAETASVCTVAEGVTASVASLLVKVGHQADFSFQVTHTKAPIVAAKNRASPHSSGRAVRTKIRAVR